MEDSSSSPDNSKHAAEISSEDKGGNVLDKLVKNSPDPGAGCKAASGG